MRAAWTLTVDLRGETGHFVGPDATGWLPPGTVSRALFATTEGFHPVGEVVFLFRGREVHLVAELTGRPDFYEVTPAMLESMSDNPDYRHDIHEWMGVA